MIAPKVKFQLEPVESNKLYASKIHNGIGMG